MKGTRLVGMGIVALACFVSMAVFAANGIDTTGESLPISAGGKQVALVNAKTLNFDLLHGAKIGAVDEDQCIGDSAAENAGLLRYTSTGMQYCDGSVWKTAFSSGENNGGFVLSCARGTCGGGGANTWVHCRQVQYDNNSNPYCYAKCNAAQSINGNCPDYAYKACSNCALANPKTGDCSCPAGTKAIPTASSTTTDKDVNKDCNNSDGFVSTTFVCQ